MAQIFTPIHNMFAKASLIVLIVLVNVFFIVNDAIHRSSYVRYTDVPRMQEVPFSHRHHASMGIDCRYCHTSVEQSNFANIPPTKTCMNCHKIVWNEAPMLEPVRSSWKNKEPMEWTRVHDLPDFAYFNHSIHIAKGVGCYTCHGNVADMPLMKREHPLFMKWCLDCHRDPTKHLRPAEFITKMDFNINKDMTDELKVKYGLVDDEGHALAKVTQKQLGEALVEHNSVDYKDHRLTNCAICHR